jgi:hypothetical protein
MTIFSRDIRHQHIRLNPFPSPVNTVQFTHYVVVVLRGVRSLFHSEFFTECDLVRHLSSYSIFSVPEGYAVAAYAFFIVFPPLLSFPVSFIQ